MRDRLLLLGAALAAFGASLSSGFHFDDYAIFQDAHLKSAWGWLEIWSLRQTRPLTYLTFWLNYQVGGQEPLGYHALNLVLHLGAVLLAYECFRRLLPGRAALVAAALFAVHPIQAEAVNYVWGRSIVLAALLSFAALLAWITGRQWTAVAWFAAALLAKEECAALPVALLLLDRKRGAPLAAMFGLALAAGARVIYATTVTPGAPAGMQAGISPWHYWLAQGPVIWRYLRLLVVPYGFTVDPDVRVPVVWVGVAAWAALAMLAALAWRAKQTWVVVGLALLLTSSSVFPAADLSADRRMYLPMIGFTAAAGGVLAWRRKRQAEPSAPLSGAALVMTRGQARRPIPPYLAAAILALVVLSIRRTQMWMSDERLWREAVARAPDKVRPKIQLARNVDTGEALALLGDARRLAPNDAAVAAETGKTLLQAGKTAAALAEFGRALALDPRDARNYNNRGVALEALGQTEAARQDFLRAIKMDASLTQARRNLEALPAR